MGRVEPTTADAATADIGEEIVAPPPQGMTRLAQHPTGIATAVATLVVIALNKLGVELTAEESAAVVGAVAVLVSAVTPR